MLAETDRYVEDLIAEIGPPAAAQRTDLGTDPIVEQLHKQREEYRTGDAGAGEPSASEPPADPPASAAG